MNFYKNNIYIKKNIVTRSILTPVVCTVTVIGSSLVTHWDTILIPYSAKYHFYLFA